MKFHWAIILFIKEVGELLKQAGAIVVRFSANLKTEPNEGPAEDESAHNPPAKKD